MCVWKGNQNQTNKTTHGGINAIDNLLERPPYAPAEAFLTMPRLDRNLSDHTFPIPKCDKSTQLLKPYPNQARAVTQHARPSQTHIIFSTTCNFLCASNPVFVHILLHIYSAHKDTYVFVNFNCMYVHTYYANHPTLCECIHISIYIYTYIYTRQANMYVYIYIDTLEYTYVFIHTCICS